MFVLRRERQIYQKIRTALLTLRQCHNKGQTLTSQVRGLGQASAALALGSAFWHGSHTRWSKIFVWEKIRQGANNDRGNHANWKNQQFWNVWDYDYEYVNFRLGQVADSNLISVMAFIMHQVHAFNIQHCVDEPSKLVFCSFDSKKLYISVLAGFPVWPPNLKSIPWVVRPLQHKASQDWCSDCTGVYFSYHVLRVIVLASYLSIGQRLVFRLHRCLTNSWTFLSRPSLKIFIAIILRL